MAIRYRGQETAFTLCADHRRTLTINDMELNGKIYTLNQCENIWKWFKESVIGEYTHYYYKVVFHTEEGFYAAYADDLSNGCFI